MNVNNQSRGRAKSHSTLLGGILLIAGSCIGAGMLALPVITGIAGFIPSTFMFVFAWAFMTATALLLLEVNLRVGHHLSLVSLAEKTLGPVGKALTWFLFLFLFFLLNVAYIAASGPIVQTLISDITGIRIAEWVGSFLFTLCFAVTIYMGVRKVDFLNRILMLGLILAYVALVFLGAFYVRAENLRESTFAYAFASIPILIVSFGFHNMIPTLSEYFNGDAKKLRLAFILGSLIPLAIYLLWEMIMLGIIPVEGKTSIIQGLREGEPITEVLRSLLGKSWVSTVAEAFSLFAITTSFLAQSLSLVDFLADGLKISKEKKNRLILVAVTLIPPFLSAFLYPHIFIHALNMAGGFSAVILFGIFPVLMVWKIRYRDNFQEPLLSGGKPLLMLILLVAFSIFVLQFAEEMGLSLLPKQLEASITC